MRACAALAAVTALLAGAPVQGQVVVRKHAPSGASIGVGWVKPEDGEAEPAWEKRCRYHLDRAEKMLNAGRKLAGTDPSSELFSQCQELAGRFNQAGQALLRQADQEYASGEYSKALRSYQRIAVGFAGFPVAKAAGTKLRSARKDPELQQALAEVRASMMYKTVELIVEQHRLRLAEQAAATTRPAASSRPAKAAPRRGELEILKQLDDERLLRVVDHLGRIVKTCPGAPTAEKSSHRLAALTADPKLKATLARLRQARKASQALALAEAYRKAGMPTEAAQRFREVIKTFPGTAQAEKARTLLADVEASLQNAYNKGGGRQR
jgi:tetratricopeptide (TPR) repeat protein